MCLAHIGKACPAGYGQEDEVRINMLGILMKLLDEPGQVGEDAPGTTNSFIVATFPEKNYFENLLSFC
jgi:hypothetical protein